MTLSEQIEHTRQEQLLAAVYDSRDRHREEMETEAHTMTHDEMIAVIAAHRDGKAIEYRYSNRGEWNKVKLPHWDFAAFQFRVAPEPKRVPLGPEDFPPGTVVRVPLISEALWVAILFPTKDGLKLADGDFWSFQYLMHWQRLLPGTTEWLPCWKEVPASDGKEVVE